MSTFAITTRTALISDLGRTLLVVGLRRQRLRVVTRLFLCRDSVGCITATRLRPNKSAAVNSTRSLACHQGRVRFAPGSWQSARLRDAQSGRRPSCKALEFKKDASCIDNWAAFAFDEPQRLTVPSTDAHSLHPATLFLMNIHQIVSDLTAERNKLDQAINALEGVNVPSTPRRGRPPKPQPSPPATGKRTMSPAARKKIALAMKLRWAKWKGKSAPKKAAKKATARKPMSPAARKKLSLLAKKRWAATKKAGGKSL